MNIKTLLGLLFQLPELRQDVLVVKQVQRQEATDQPVRARLLEVGRHQAQVLDLAVDRLAQMEAAALALHAR